jgi:hypothetical protein
MINNNTPVVQRVQNYRDEIRKKFVRDISEKEALKILTEASEKGQLYEFLTQTQGHMERHIMPETKVLERLFAEHNVYECSAFDNKEQAKTAVTQLADRYIEQIAQFMSSSKMGDALIISDTAFCTTSSIDGKPIAGKGITYASGPDKYSEVETDNIFMRIVRNRDGVYLANAFPDIKEIRIEGFTQEGERIYRKLDLRETRRDLRDLMLETDLYQASTYNAQFHQRFRCHPDSVNFSDYHEADNLYLIEKGLRKPRPTRRYPINDLNNEPTENKLTSNYQNSAVQNLNKEEKTQRKLPHIEGYDSQQKNFENTQFE